MLLNFEECKECMSNGTGLNNISKKIYSQFKEINKLEGAKIGSLRPQAVDYNYENVGFTVVIDFINDYRNECKNVTLRQNYNYDGIFIGDLKTGVVYYAPKTMFIVGSITRKSPGYINARETAIDIVSKSGELKKVDLKIYP